MRTPITYQQDHTIKLEYDAIRYYNGFVNGKPFTFECDKSKNLQARVVWLDCDFGLVYHPSKNIIFGTACFFIHHNGTELPFYEFYEPSLFFKLIKLNYNWSYIKESCYGLKIFALFRIDKRRWEQLEPITVQEAFSIENEQMRSLAFQTINIVEMIEGLGYKKISVAGKRVNRLFWDKKGNEITKEIDVVYELLEVNTFHLSKSPKNRGMPPTDYCVKCWCTTTNEEHYLWVDPRYTDCPLTAIASTCRVQEDLVDDIKSIKRQGDLFLIEYKEGFTIDRIDSGPFVNKVPLTKDQYFNLLIAEA